MMLGIQTDAEDQMLARRNAEAIRMGDEAARAQGRTPPAVTVQTTPSTPRVTTPLKPAPSIGGAPMDRTTAGVFQQQRETEEAVMKEFQNLYGPRVQVQPTK
jgi:hypothetical protein